ncbi:MULTISPECIES: AEC family transporter [Mameliella]|uniref:AEC family transporter n=1 Tax=Mameliella TaxID=1434019 RepID=UPI000B532B16|nr:MULTISPECIES: AEC family transporter [Mameliella]MBV6634867.1 AEC family transporter [Mameliella sp.]MCR9275144.1 AEC family transporter [Paracoccaceae bacterium]MBY6122186.1 AEC family transporter [Mameliella alba]OWV39810.1 malate transporter [Mameliella alba]OWV52396.1 malate transporter [Mameliella alba]
MLDIFLKTLPFFGLIGLGYGAAKSRFFSEEASAALTKFVFFFALSAMLFRFSANLRFDEIFEPRLASAYLWGTAVTWGLGMAVAFLRGLDVPTASIEAQCAAIGNTGFLGVPMLALLLGQEAVGPIILILSIDLIVFSSLLTLLVTGAREGHMGLGILWKLLLGLLKNPMIVSIGLGLMVSASGLPVPEAANSFLTTLGNAATPGALFAIGASLASKSAERIQIAAWLSFAKLVLHPLFVGLGVYVFFPVDAYRASVAVSAAALPVAGNVFILAQHYGIAPQRVSASILISTTASIVTVSAIIATVTSWWP